MKRIRHSCVEQILDSADIVEIIAPWVELRKAGNSWKGCCPFHQEKTPSFNVTPSRGLYHCFGCGASGNLLGFLRDKAGMDFVQAMEYLSERTGIALEYESGSDNPAQRHRERRLDINNQVQMVFRRQLGQSERARSYLRQRQIGQELAERFGFGYAEGREQRLPDLVRADLDELKELGLVAESDDGRDYDRFRDRLMLPVCDRRGMILGFAGRDLSGRSPAKYMNTPETPLFHKRELLFGQHLARPALRKRSRMLVMEGYFDVIRAHQYGFEEAVAVMGTALSPEHLRGIGESIEIYLLFDGDQAGEKALQRSAELTRQCPQPIRAVLLPGGQDPDSFLLAEGAKALDASIEQAEDLGERHLRTIAAQARNDTSGIAEAASLMRTWVDGVGNQLKRQGYQQFVRNLLEIDPWEPSRSGIAIRGRRDQPTPRKKWHDPARRIIQFPRLDKNSLEKDLFRLMLSSDEAFEFLLEDCSSDILQSPYDKIFMEAVHLHTDQGLSAPQIAHALLQGPQAAYVRQFFPEAHQPQEPPDLDLLSSVSSRIRQLTRTRRLKRLQDEVARLEVDPAPESQQRLRELLDEITNLNRERSLGG